MAATGTMTFSGTISGLASGSDSISLSQAIVSAPGVTTMTALASGANTITVPTGTTYVVIIPPVGNVIAMTLKGISGDTGIALHKTAYTILGVDSTVSSFVVNAGSAFSNAVAFKFV